MASSGHPFHSTVKTGVAGNPKGQQEIMEQVETVVIEKTDASRNLQTAVSTA